MMRWQRCASLGQSSKVMLHCALKLAGGTHKTVFFVQRRKTFQIKTRLSPQNHNHEVTLIQVRYNLITVAVRLDHDRCAAVIVNVFPFRTSPESTNNQSIKEQ